MSELPRYVLGVDGGFKTGLYVYDLLFEIGNGLEVGWSELHREVEPIIRELRPTVSAEKFIISPSTAKNTQAPWTLKANGYVEQLCLMYGCYYTEETSSTAKSVVSDDRLKAFGWHQKGRGHQNDGARQVGVKLLKAGWMHPSIISSLTADDSHDNVTTSEIDGNGQMDNVVYLPER